MERNYWKHKQKQQQINKRTEHRSSNFSPQPRVTLVVGKAFPTKFEVLLPNASKGNASKGNGYLKILYLQLVMEYMETTQTKQINKRTKLWRSNFHPQSRVILVVGKAFPTKNNYIRHDVLIPNVSKGNI